MTVVKRLSKKRRFAILEQIEEATRALMGDDQGLTLGHLDKAMKLFNGREPEGMRYDELDDACEAFLTKAGYLSLSSLLVYIESWKSQAPKVNLAEGVLAATCDMTHYWRCEAWNTEDGKRLSNHPSPTHERCTCGLMQIVARINEISKAEPSD